MIYLSKIKPVPLNRKLLRGRGSRLYINKEYRDTWNLIQTEWQKQTNVLLGKIGVEIRFGWAKMDIDSCIKPILDTLEGIAYKNDKQVIDLRVFKDSSEQMEIIVYKINE